MRNAKKLASLLLALAMLLTLSVNVFAAGEGSITIGNAVVGQTYTIYRILDLESYNAQSGAYAYKANSNWSAFVASDGIKDVYLKTDTQGYVTWVGDATAERAADFAKLAQAYAKANTVTPDGTAEAGEEPLKFENLPLGYYLVDSTLGTLCALDTTNPDVKMEEKNKEPSNVKEVQEDSTGNYGSENDADINQVVNFKSTITAQAGAQNYVFHDEMSAGLTFGSVTGITLNDKAVDATNYEVKTAGFTDTCTFEVVFKQEFCDSLKADDKIVISYTATVNENAVIGGAGNDNTSKIEYGESGKTTTTPPSKTTTYTWSIPVYKYTVNGETEKVLKGAEFVLYKTEGEKTLYAKADTSYKITGWTENKEDATTFVTAEDGKLTISGLDSDT